MEEKREVGKVDFVTWAETDEFTQREFRTYADNCFAKACVGTDGLNRTVREAIKLWLPEGDETKNKDGSEKTLRALRTAYNRVRRYVRRDVLRGYYTEICIKNGVDVEWKNNILRYEFSVSFEKWIGERCKRLEERYGNPTAKKNT